MSWSDYWARSMTVYSKSKKEVHNNRSNISIHLKQAHPLTGIVWNRVYAVPVSSCLKTGSIPSNRKHKSTHNDLTLQSKLGLSLQKIRQ